MILHLQQSKFNLQQGSEHNSLTWSKVDATRINILPTSICHSAPRPISEQQLLPLLKTWIRQAPLTVSPSPRWGRVTRLERKTRFESTTAGARATPMHRELCAWQHGCQSQVFLHHWGSQSILSAVVARQGHSSPGASVLLPRSHDVPAADRAPRPRELRALWHWVEVEEGHQCSSRPALISKGLRVTPEGRRADYHQQTRTAVEIMVEGNWVQILLVADSGGVREPRPPLHHPVR